MDIPTVQVTVAPLRTGRKRRVRIGKWNEGGGRDNPLYTCSLYSTCGLAEELAGDGTITAKPATSSCGSVRTPSFCNSMLLKYCAPAVLFGRCISLCQLPLSGHARFQIRRTGQTL